MAGELTGKVAVITGCSSLIGRKLALRFAAEGARLAICSRSLSGLEETARQCREEGAPVLSRRCDVADQEDIHNFINSVIDEYGAMNILVNNAVSEKPGSPFSEGSPEYLQGLWASGFLATWRMMNLSFPHLKKSGGKIINFSSASGLRDTASGYGEVEDAILGVSKAVGREWLKDNVGVFTIFHTTDSQGNKSVIADLPGTGDKAERAVFLIKDGHARSSATEDIVPVAAYLAKADSAGLRARNYIVVNGAVGRCPKNGDDARAGQHRAAV